MFERRLAEAEYVHGGTQKNFYGESEREECSCPLCSSDTYSLIDVERGLGIVKCDNCGLIYTNPRANNAEENYFGDASVFFEEARQIFDGKKTHHRDKNYEYEVRKIKALKSSGRLLDVGTNMGFFLRKAREAGFDCHGVEPSPSLSQIAREQWSLDIQTSFLQDAEFEKESFDVITMIDVFEHVTDPQSMLDSCMRLLKPDGLLVIKVPNGDYNHFKLKLSSRGGKRDEMLDIWDSCEHVVHYTPDTMKKMAALTGFKIRKQFIPLPIHPPIWAKLVGHYYQYPSPYILDWKRVMMRTLFYRIGSVELKLRNKSIFGPDLMFFLSKA